MKWLFLFALVALAASRSQGLQVGDPAPDIAAPSTGATSRRLSDLKGSWVVLYFYPKSFTPGCTAESCSLRDGHAELSKLNAVVIGVSVDSLDAQQKFKAKHNLPFELLSDSSKHASRAFGSLGVGGLVAQRKTFIINPDGKIAHIFEKVNTAGHDQEVLDALRKLQSGGGTAPAP